MERLKGLRLGGLFLGVVLGLLALGAVLSGSAGAQSGGSEALSTGLNSSPQHQEVSATLVTEPGLCPACRMGFEQDERGRLRAIVLSRRPLDLAGNPSIQVDHVYTRLIDGLAVRVEPSALEALRAAPGVQAIFPDARLEADMAESVPLVGAPAVWALSDRLGQPVTGRGVRVAVIDTGVDYTHAALGGCFGAGCKVVSGYDWVHEDGDPMDDHGHGTHVAGIVAAGGTVPGMAPGAEILAYKVLSEQGWGYASDVIAALEQAIADGARVINLSLGAAGAPGDPVSLAAEAAFEAGCVVVAAAGNRGSRPFTVDAPAVAPHVLAVAASDKQDHLAGFSSRGPVAESLALKPDLTAPGVEISSTVPLSGPMGAPGGWLPASGTSMAAPHVAGGAAMLCQLHPDWTALEVQAAMMNYAHDLGAGLFSQGTGRLELLPAALAPLLAVPPSLSFGLPLLDGTEVLTLAVRNAATATQVVTVDLELAQAADGTGRPITPTLPVPYAAVSPQDLVLAPGEAGILTVTLEIPPSAVDGYYEGRLRIAASSRLAVPMAFALLSRVAVRVLDEEGVEITGWGHMAALARVPDADFLISNIPLSLPAVFTVPSGEYHAQAFGRVGLYDHLLIPGMEQQVPYALIQPATVQPHTSQTITLSVVDTRSYWLPAIDLDANPVFINAWAESFRYRAGDATWLTRLGQSNVRVLSTNLPGDWPEGFRLRLSDTPPGVSFGLSLQGVGFSEQYRSFVERHGTRWPADQAGNAGFPLYGSADLVQLLAWERSALGSGTPAEFAVTADEVGRYAVRTDLPGLLDPPWVGWETSAEGWWYPPTGGSSALEPVAAGLTRAWTVAGAQHSAFWAGSLGRYRRFQRSFYTPDWTLSHPWDKDQDVVLPEEAALHPLPPGEAGFSVGAGPLFPTVTFDNRPGAIQMRHPLLAGAAGTPVIWGSAAPGYRLTRDGVEVASGTLPEVGLLPFPMRRWVDLTAGDYELTITPTLDGSAIGPSIIRAGFALSNSPADDPNPPQLLDLTLPQRYETGTTVTATWSLSDASPVHLSASARFGDGAWEPLDVAGLGDGRFAAQIEAGTAPTVTLSYTATDLSGNWLAWQAGGGTSALAEVPVHLAFEMDPPSVPWTSRPVQVRLVGSLLGDNGLSLSLTPAWIRLEAGGRLAGYVRDLTGTPGSYRTGLIDFSWSLVPAELMEGPGALPVEMSLDLGLYAPQATVRILQVVAPVYVPLVGKGSGR